MLLLLYLIFFFPSVKLTFISSFKFKLLAIAAVSCCRPDSDMKYILGGWLETCDDNTWSLGPCGGIAELLMLLRDKRGKKWYQVELNKLCKNDITELKLHFLLMNVKRVYKRRCRYGFLYFGSVPQSECMIWPWLLDFRFFVFTLAYRHVFVTWVSSQPNRSQTNMELVQDYIHRRMATRMAAHYFCTMDKLGGQ